MPFVSLLISIYNAEKIPSLVIADFYRVDGAVFTDKQHIRERGCWQESHTQASNRKDKGNMDLYEENKLPPGYTRVSHGFEPIYDNHSRILILGSFPSVKSRENSFYYGHPQNRFWKLFAKLLQEPVPGTIEEKKLLLLSHSIAVWDVVAACDIKGSSDSSIRNVIPADINRILRAANIEQIIANGDTAFKLYHKYCEPNTGRTAVKCPSTSPANAVFTLDRLVESWSAAMPGIAKSF